MKVLVTGHLGYIGTILTPMLFSEGFEVTGLDSDLYRTCTYGAPFTHVPTIEKDIRDVEAKDLEGFDAILHLAGLSNDPLGEIDSALTYEINYQASVRLAKLARDAGVQRFVYSSSCSNYGAGGEAWMTEESFLKPVTAYGRSKVFSEIGIGRLSSPTFAPTFLRNATAYGVSPRLRFDLVLNNLVAWAVTTGKIHLKSDGGAWRPIVHIEDISRAFVAVLKAPMSAVNNAFYNVGRTKENYRVRDLALIVGETVPNCEIEFAEGASADKRCYRVNCDKIESELPDFSPEWNARQGAQELYEAYRQYGLTLEEFEGPKFQRVAYIKSQMVKRRITRDLRIRSGDRSGTAVPFGP